MSDIIKLTFTLALISTIAGFAIGAVNDRTKDRIAEQQLAARKYAIEAVFADDIDDIREMKAKGAGIVPDLYWTGFKNGKLAGYAFEVSGRGYAGDIKFMVGVDVAGKITGVSVLDHNETPGLGSRVNEVPSTRYVWNPFVGEDAEKPWFTEQFENLSSMNVINVDRGGEWHTLGDDARENLRDRNAVTAITGSTITTTAFTRAIEQHVATYVRELAGHCCIERKLESESEWESDTITWGGIEEIDRILTDGKGLRQADR